MKKENWPILILLFLLFWEISNPGALRQGTEGFYLKIAQEMSQNKNFLTPSYMGEAHWSKPPLHFWLPQVLTIFGSEFNLLTARISILLFTLGSIFYLSVILKRITKKPALLFFIALITSFAFLKYSRIYMMEAPLALLCAISVISFFEFLEFNRKKSFYISVFFAAASCLVKGPVSLVMIYLAIGLYVLKPFSICNVKKYLHFITLSFVFSTPWFFICFYKYGLEFYYYFFVRENLGKFSAQSYPIQSVFYGFLVYGMPLTLFVPIIFKNFSLIKKDNFLYFLLICILSFFTLWLIPHQRSYHYAIPSIPFYLILMVLLPLQEKWLSYFNYILISISIIICLIAKMFFPAEISLMRLVFTCSFIFVVFIINRKSTLINSLLVFGIISLTMLNILLPAFYRPVLPDNVVKYLEQRTAPTVIIKHPYFIEDLIHKSVAVIDLRELSSSVDSSQGLYITSRDHFLTVQGKTRELTHWAVWRRGLKFKEILEALINKNTKLLEEDYVLFTNDTKFFQDRI